MSAHVTRELEAFLDGELAAAERTAVSAHLAECDACARQLEEMAAVDATARSLVVEAPAGYFDDFASRVRAKLRAPARRRFTPPAWTLAVAAALVLAVLTPLTLRQLEAPGTSPSPASARPAATEPQAPPMQEAEGPPPASPAASADQPARGGAPADALAASRRPAAPAAPALARPPTPAAPQELKEEARVEPETPPPPAAGAFAAAPLESREQDALKSKALRADAEGAAEKAHDRSRAAGTNAVPGFTAAELRYRSLLARRASTLAEVRALREAWRGFVQAEPTGPRSDEARVRVIEVGVEAFRLSHEESDRALAERDAADYLARSDAAQAERVREILRAP